MDDCDLVIVPAAQPVAFSVHGQPDQVVVSRGLLDCLSPAEVDAVLAHEASHLRHNHHRYLLVASALEGALGFVPAVRSSASALRTALERWADEAAARECPEGRPIVRRALLRASGFASMPDVAAFNGADDVMERAQALARDPWTGGWRRRMASYTPVAALSLAAVTATWTWLGQAGAVAAMAGMCGARL